MSVWALMLGGFLAVVTLMACANALRGDSGAGAAQRHLIGGVPAVGWVSLAMATSALVSAPRTIAFAARRRRWIRRELHHLPRRRIDDISIAPIDRSDVYAMAVPGDDECVLVSQGALVQLCDDELRALIHHEQAHLRMGHHRDLLLARVAERSCWFVPGIHRAAATLRLSLEVSADAASRQQLGVAPISGALRLAGEPSGSPRRLAVDASRSRYWGVLAIAVMMGVSLFAISAEFTWLMGGP
ncbi:MAG: M56 family metallopeptidase [Acidimicrobiales bacterium]|nr:M56 family metallopeptidase [Acidimicrobiales bacterium]